MKIPALIAILFALATARCVAQSQELTDSQSRSSVGLPAPVEIENGLLKARFVPTADGVKQEYFARRKGEWVSVVESFRPSHPAGHALYDSTRDPAHRLLVSEGLNSVRRIANDERQGLQQVELTGSIANQPMTQTVTLRKGETFAHIEVRATLANSTPAGQVAAAKLEYLLSTFTFCCEGKPDFIHTPKSKGPSWFIVNPVSGLPGTPDSPEFIIGDRVFYAPAVIVQKKSLFAALVPDLDLINRLKVTSPDARPSITTFAPTPVDPANNSMPTALDYTLPSGMTPQPLMAYGLIDFIPVHHMRWRHTSDGKMVRTLASPRVGYGFDLFVSADAQPYRGFQQVARHQWERYGWPLLAKPRPQAMPFVEYLKAIYPACLAWNKNQGYAEFEMDGQKVGGWCLAAPFWPYVLSNGPWWNNPRDATGMFLWAQRTHDDKLLERARRIINLALLAPRTDGLFACEYHVDRKEWKPGLFFVTEKAAPNAMFGTVDATNLRPRSYHTAGCSITAVHLLRYHRLCENNDRIVAYLRPYGDFLLRHIDTRGQIPMFFTAEGKPSNVLPDHGENGAHLWFLCELYAATKDPRYLDGATKVADYLIQEVIPRQRWRDFESFFSCGCKPMNWEDKTQEQDPRGQTPMIWAPAGLGELFRLTGNHRYLDAGEQAIDYACLYQTVWDPHFVYTAYAFGGFDTDNGDAAWLNCHTAWTIGTLAFYGKELGRQDLLERAVAAARAGVTVINHPRHISNNIYRFPNYPLGLGGENINHEGSEQSCGRSAPGAGEGTGVFAGLSDAVRELGGVYVDFGKKVAVGVDGVYVRSYRLDGKTVRLDLVNQLAALPDPYDKPYEIELRVVGLKSGRYQLIINGRPAIQVTDWELAHYQITIPPSGDARAAVAPAGTLTPRDASACPLKNASATFEQDGFPVANALVDNSAGWAIHPKTRQDQSAMFETEMPLSLTNETRLVFTLRHAALANFNIGRFRISATGDTLVGPASTWTPLVPESAASAGRATLSVQADNSILAGGANPDHDTYTVAAKTSLSRITGFRLEVLKDPALPETGPGRDALAPAGSKGNFVLTLFKVGVQPRQEPNLNSQPGSER